MLSFDGGNTVPDESVKVHLKVSLVRSSVEVVRACTLKAAICALKSMYPFLLASVSIIISNTWFPEGAAYILQVFML